jgi:RNA polymerase sigma factor for flagellar operon FliA
VRFAVELDDLVGFGMIGLLNAMERFDPSRGTLLRTYAEHRIRGAILDGLRSMDWLPRSARQRERQRQENERTDSCTRFFSLRNVAQPSEPILPGARAPRVRRSVTRIEVVFTGGNLTDLEQLAEGTGPVPRSAGDSSPEALYERQEQRVRLAGAVDRLPRRHREIIELYYHQELSMKQIGQRMSIHESRVSQLHAAAIQRLRSYLSPGPQPA